MPKPASLTSPGNYVFALNISAILPAASFSALLPVACSPCYTVCMASGGRALLHNGIEMRAGGGEREVRQRLDEIFFLDLLMHSGCVSALETFILSIIHRV